MTKGKAVPVYLKYHIVVYMSNLISAVWLLSEATERCSPYHLEIGRWNPDDIKDNWDREPKEAKLAEFSGRVGILSLPYRL